MDRVYCFLSGTWFHNSTIQTTEEIAREKNCPVSILTMLYSGKEKQKMPLLCQLTEDGKQ